MTTGDCCGCFSFSHDLPFCLCERLRDDLLPGLFEAVDVALEIFELLLHSVDALQDLV